MNVETCCGCGGVIPVGSGPIHSYMTSAPGCWDRYCSLEDWKARLSGPNTTTVIQNLVDSYSAQHPRNTDRRNRQSVALHLMSLCAGIERNVGGVQRHAILGSKAHRGYPLLKPAPTAFSITAADVASAPADTRPSLIQEMAATTWSSWEAHHETIRRWLDAPK